MSWLLKFYPEKSIAVLVGLMIGSLQKVRPWQNTLNDSVKESQAVLPKQYDGDPQIAIAILWIFIGFAIIFIIERGKTLLSK